MRQDGRGLQEIRKVKIQSNILRKSEGSVLVSVGDTKIICRGSVKESSEFLKGTGTGWITASCKNITGNTIHSRSKERNRKEFNKVTTQISNLIENSLLAVTELAILGERVIHIDCDILQIDGDFIAPCITAAFTTLRLVVDGLLQKKLVATDPLQESIAAINTGILATGECAVDLTEDESMGSLATMLLVMTESGRFVECHSSGKMTTFKGQQLNECLIYGQAAIEDVLAYQKEALFLDIETKEKVDSQTIIIATGNMGKAREFSSMFQKAGYKIKTMNDFPELPEVEETGKTFEENARLKAETIAHLLKCPVLADDSGLKVDALDGRPGVYSARFAGEQKSDAANNAKLLYELTNIPDEKRAAQFHCTLVFAAPQKESLVVEADWNGHIGRIPRGENGFGYDPLFIVDGLDKTAAELPENEKNAISHRGQAMAKLQEKWQVWLNQQE
ncbi:MAG TPA: nucleoside-triphosphate diphosphatase [Candidatus Tetragenococcus pullicola]|nr:nucleoside-triphosphate diphosphatase [Candidatus Tetragenococcus pullicola]